MSVMLVRPRTPDTSRSGLVSIQYPINIGYLSAYLQKHSIKCAMRDFEIEGFRESEFLSSLKNSGCSLVGLSCMTPHIRHAAFIINLIKKHFSHILTVMGGVHATAIPERTLNEIPGLDVVVMGEGENTLLDLYNACQKGENLDTIPGIAFRKNGSTQINPQRPFIKNLDDIPFPDRSIYNIKTYKKSHVSRGISHSMYRIAEIITSRGCPYDCIFCASKIIHSRIVRFRSPQNIIAEIDYLTQKMRANHLSFLDDTFTLRKDILWPVCDHIRKRKLSFDCSTRVNDTDEEKILMLVKSGCKKISFGIESGSPKILKLLKKDITIAQVEQVFYWAKKHRLPLIEASFMIASHPDETPQDMALTQKMIFKLKPDILTLFIGIPYPGTELYSILKQRNLLTSENWDEYKLFFGHPVWRMPEISDEELKTFLKKTLNAFYFRPRYLFSLMRKVKDLKELLYWMRCGFSFIKMKFKQ